ncbi:pyruvate dehydrogenase complex dihydrolipoamide acetyltransferase [Spartobacteria bacterium LR76]|nr:pyruvate dehydrogenase complex dihydrolipoamide acetyltransferase [Spartobacteria bacterium LR76]
MPNVTMPKLSDTMTEGTITRWRKKKGDTVEMGDILAEVETDKATMEMEAFDDGVLHEIFVPDGGKAKVGDAVALILAEGETAESAGKTPAAKNDLTTSGGKEAAPATAAPAAKAAEGSADSDSRVKASPLARKIAKEKGISLASVQGSGPGGRIVVKDLEGAPSAPAPAAAAPAPAAAPAIQATAGASDTKVPLSGMRRTIAERLVASKQQNPHFYLSVEVDAGPLMKLRTELNKANEAAGQPKLTVNDFVLLAISRAAAAHPYVNASWGGDSIIQYASVNISVAVAVDDGLVTPVIRNAAKLSLKEISASVKDLAARARTKKLKPEEYQGGTITVSNLGSYGVEQFYAIVNPPQAAIVAVGAIVKKPVVNAKDEIVVGQRMVVSLSGDHRVVDGAIGAEFLGTLRKLIENPALMLF